MRRKLKQTRDEAATSESPTSPVSRVQPRIPAAAQKGLTQFKDLEEEAALFRELQAEAEILEAQARAARECPVPKPTGWVGRMLGFEEQRKGLANGGTEKG